MECPVLQNAQLQKHVSFTALQHLIWDQQEENSPLQSCHVNKELIYPLKLRYCLFTFSEVKDQSAVTNRNSPFQGKTIGVKLFTYWFPNSDATKRNPVFSTHMAAATGTVSKYFSRISVT